MVRWIVSLESPPTPARAALLAALSGALGLQDAEPGDAADQDCAQGPLDSLLARMRGLARLPADAHAAWSTSCLLDVPEDAVWRRLYAELSAELVDRLVPGGAAGTRHLMLCLEVDSDEAFESLFAGCSLQGAGCPLARRESTLEDVARCCERVAAAGLDDEATPFAARRLVLRCPRFAADNPVSMQALEAEAVRLCGDAMREPQPQRAVACSAAR